MKRGQSRASGVQLSVSCRLHFSSHLAATIDNLLVFFTS